MDGQTGLGATAFIFALVAAYFFYSGYTLPTSVNQDGQGYVANLELMHIQSINFATAIGASVIAAILAVGASIVSAINSRAEAVINT